MGLLLRLKAAVRPQLAVGVQRRALSGVNLPLHRLPQVFAGIQPPADECIRSQVQTILERNNVQETDTPLDLQLKFNVGCQGLDLR